MLTTVYLTGEIGHLFGRKHKLAVASPAEALRLIEANRPGFAAYLCAAGDRGIDFKVKVGGDCLAKAEDLKFERPGRTIRLSPIVRGRKNATTGIIIGVALVAFSWGLGAGALPFFQGLNAAGFAANAFGIAGMTYGTLIGTIGLSMAIGGISQLLSPTPKGPELSDGKPSYIFNGPVNTVEQGGPVPLAYGQIIVGSRLASSGMQSEDLGAAIAAPSGDNDGEGSFTTDPEYPTTAGSIPATNLRGRSLQTRQILRQLHVLSDGEVAGICDASGNLLDYAERNKGIFLDETPVQNSDGSLAQPEVTTAFRPGTASQTYLAGFPSAEADVSVNVQVKKLGDKWANSVQRTVPAGQHNAIKVTVRFPALYEIDSKGNRTGSAVHFGIQIKRTAEVDWREVVGGNLLPNGELDGLIQGEATEPYLRSFRIPLYGTGPWDVRVGRESADSADPTKVQNDLYWHSYTKITDYKIAYRHTSVLGVEYSAERYSSAAAVAVRLKGIKVKVPSNYDPVTRNYDGAWDGKFAGVDVTLSADYTAGGDTLFVDALDAALPVNSPIEITVGSTMYRAYLLEEADVGATSLSISPINANLANGATGRGFELKWTNNPAWIYWDLSTHPRYGLGQYISDASLDRSALYEIARYCDGVDGDGNFVGVDTGKGDGSREPRFTFNTYIQSTAEAYKVLADLSSSFRGMVYWGSGFITAVQDAPKIPRFNFTDANVIDGAFNFSSTAAKSRHTICYVQWNDPDDFYSAKFEDVPDEAGIEELGFRPITVVAYGCTSRGQARRVGLWKLLTERLENDTVTFRTAIEGARCRPGDICRVSARFKTAHRMYGRLANVGSGTVTLDAPVALASGTWTLYVAKQDGTEVELTISDPAGTYTTVNVSGSLTGVVPGAVFILRSATIEPALYRILNVKEIEQRRYEVTALLYNESKYGAIEDGLSITTPPTSDFPPTDVPAAPASITIEETFVDTASGSQRFLTVSWEASASWWIKDYVVEYREPNGEWALLDETSSLSAAPVLVTALGDHSFRVYARSTLGRLSTPAQDSYTLAEVVNPDPPENLEIAEQAQGFFLQWDNPDNPNLTAIEIQESLDGDFTDPPEDPSPIIGTAPADRLTRGAFHRGGVMADYHRWYRVRARNRSGGKSEWTDAVDATAVVTADGHFIDYIFQRNASAPSTPTGDTPSGWFDAPPSGTDPLWMSLAEKTADGVLVGSWSTPVRLDGNSIKVEYSVDGSTSWHSTFTTGDIYMRTSTDGGSTWSAAIRIVGEQGAAGDPGPGLVSMGDFSGGTVYYKNATRRDVVKSGGNFYITLNAAKNGTATWGSPGGPDWEGPYSSYRFVATALLLAEDATITKTLTMGDGATGNGGIIRSVGATAFGTGNGFWLNPRNGSNVTEFRVGNPSGQYLSFDGTNLVISGKGDFVVTNDPTRPTWQGDSSLSGRGLYVQTGGTTGNIECLTVGASPAFFGGNVCGGSFSSKSATPSNVGSNFDLRVYDGSSWGTAGSLRFRTLSTVTSTNFNSALTLLLWRQGEGSAQSPSIPIYFEGGNVELLLDGVGSGGFCGGRGVMSIRDRHTAPTSNPSNGILVYSESGHLAMRDNGGDVTLTSAILTFRGDTNLYRASANELKTDDALTIQGVTTHNNRIDITSTNRLNFSAANSGGTPVAYAAEDWGINLWGDGTHPVHIRNASIVRGGTLGGNYGTQNILGFIVDFDPDAATGSLPCQLQAKTETGSDSNSYLKMKGPGGSNIWVRYLTSLP